MDTLNRRDLAERFNVGALREGLSQRSAYVWVAVIVLALVTFMVVTNSFVSKRERRLAQRQVELSEFYILLSDYKRDMASIGHLRKKLRQRDVEGSIGTVIEEIGASIGLKKKITSFKPLAETQLTGYTEKGVQVEIEGVTLNEAVNLLYRIKGDKRLLLIRDFSMKNHFQNPELVDITLKVVLITTSEGTS